jgi:hypothetical protein
LFEFINNQTIESEIMLKNIDFSSTKNILFVALIVRLLAAIFSGGYGMHDDHFLIIEAASSWSDGYDYNNWLPWSAGNQGFPDGHSFTYVGLNYIYFVVFKFLGISDPKTLMLINRLFHAVFSLLIISYGIKITEYISNRKNAVVIGWLLALLWIMPFLSVRNLVEITAIPFLMAGVWVALQNKKKASLFYAGILIGMAVAFRYQVGIFAVGMAAYYYFKWHWNQFILFCLGVLTAFGITQGVVDYFIWGYPFAEFIGYIIYNSNQGPQYMPNTNYFMYFFVLFGVLLVPFGLLVARGFFRFPAQQYWVFVPAGVALLLGIYFPAYQIYWIALVVGVVIIYGAMGKMKNIPSIWMLYLPTIFFILFHTFYPNRQERFVLTVLPLVMIIGVVGYEVLRQKKFWDKAWNVSWKIFWIINIPLLLFTSFTSSKISRVNAMYAIKDENITGKSILLEASGNSSTSMLPRFYADEWDVGFTEREEPTQPLLVTEGNQYDFVFFFGEDGLSERIAAYQELYPKMQLLEKCEPSTLDKILFKMNPRNTNQYIEVWRTNR